MTGSEILFIFATLFWCQAMPSRMLYLYAASVLLTAAIKYFFLE